MIYNTDTFVREYKKQNDTLIKDIENKIADISVYDDAINASKFIQLTLHKLSAQVALCVFLKQNEITIPSRDFDKILREFEKLVAFQLKVVSHNGIHISNTEWKENFLFWQEVDRKVLHDFVIKENYLVTMLYKFLFVNDIRWRVSIVNLYCNIAISAQNFSDIEMFSRNDPSHYVSFDVVKQTLDLTYNLYDTAAQICIEAQSYDKNNVQWYNKALQFLSGLYSISKLLKNIDKLSAIDARIETLQRRIEVEKKHTK